VPIVPREEFQPYIAPGTVLVHEKKKHAPRIKHSIDEIEYALRACSGYISVAARFLGITARGLRVRIQRDKRLQLILEDVREEDLDNTEMQLDALIKDKTIPAIIWKLKCRGRHRGWIERDDYNAPVNDTVLQPPTIIINFITPGMQEKAQEKKALETVTIDGGKLAELPEQKS
jgi:regulatory Fis family protein